ncbi:MAG: OB-fold nucleic acid binding domain-containing protein, partial [Anaerovoracaceae bacterium]
MSTEEKKNQNNTEVSEELTEENLTEQRQIRRDKLKKMQEAGRNPFINETWDVTAYSQSIKDNFDEMDGKEVSIAGRMMAKRGMGKASFIDIQDKEGRIQC